MSKVLTVRDILDAYWDNNEFEYYHADGVWYDLDMPNTNLERIEDLCFLESIRIKKKPFKHTFKALGYNLAKMDYVLGCMAEDGRMDTEKLYEVTIKEIV